MMEQELWFPAYWVLYWHTVIVRNSYSCTADLNGKSLLTFWRWLSHSWERKLQTGQITIIILVVGKSLTTLSLPTDASQASAYSQVPTTVHSIALWPLSMLRLHKYSLILQGALAGPLIYILFLLSAQLCRSGSIHLCLRPWLEPGLGQ